MISLSKTYDQQKTEVKKKKPRTYNKLIDLLKCVVLSSVSISEQTKQDHETPCRHDVLLQIDTHYSHLSVSAFQAIQLFL